MTGSIGKRLNQSFTAWMAIAERRQLRRVRMGDPRSEKTRACSERCNREECDIA